MGTLPFASIDVGGAVDFPDFDERFTYEGDDLGSIYQKEGTTFTVWAPLAETVDLELVDLKDKKQILPMAREDKGIYRLKVKGDLLNYKYHYIVMNNGIKYIVNDP